MKQVLKNYRFYVTALLVLGSLAAIGIASSLAIQAINHYQQAEVSTTGFRPQSKLFLQGESKLGPVGSNQSVVITLDSAGANASQVKATLGYDPALITVQSIITTNSPCSAITEQRYDNEKGEVIFSCQIAERSLKEQINRLATIMYRPASSGIGAFAFSSSETKVASPNGTDLLTMAPDFHFLIP
jgi:hypothetical protein